MQNGRTLFKRTFPKNESQNADKFNGRSFHQASDHVPPDLLFQGSTIEFI